MISCLCVTHERPEFMPWIEYQFAKQFWDNESWEHRRLRVTSSAPAELLILDSSKHPWVSEFATVIHCPELPGISAKRSLALTLARPIISWFDDDDWQSPTKIWRGARYVVEDGDFSAVGSRHAFMHSTITGKCCKYESRYEPLIFNSAVYRKASVPDSFNAELLTGEDTDWHDRFFLSQPNYVTLGDPMHAWLCHHKNITNTSKSRFFELNSAVPFDAWERDFLRRLHT